MAKTRLRDRDWYEIYIDIAAVDGRQADVCAEEKDLVIIGGGVAGYVAAIKAGQEGLKVRPRARKHTRARGENIL
jgi:NADPH-dependent 2,4-dienoyl-CoA reductase/sulfur reductase-like enzyme